MPKKVLFDHVPKTGGTSISGWLKEVYPAEQRYFPHPINTQGSFKLFRAWPAYRRNSYRLIAGHDVYQLLPDINAGEYVKATVLRDPIERIVSHHYFLQTLGIECRDYRANLLELAYYYRNIYSRRFGDSLHTFDVVGITEDLDCFAEALAKKAEIDIPFGGRVLNTTRNRVSVDCLPRDVVDRIIKLNQDDIEFYEYWARHGCSNRG